MIRSRLAPPVLALALAVALALALLTQGGRAHADDALAREHFKRGVDLYDKKQYAPALESFQKAYAEKTSPGIKQNIALCLKGLGRPIEAATAFDEALDEGQGTLRPEVRAAMEKELVELAKILATIRLKVVSMPDQLPASDVVVSVDGKPLSAAALRRPIRLEPGIHVFTAHGDRYQDPAEKKLSLLAATPVDATFGVVLPKLSAPGYLSVHPNVPEAVVEVDGVAVAPGTWPIRLPAGKHRLAVSAKGYTTINTEIAVSPDATVEYPMTLTRPGAVAPPYDPTIPKPGPLLKSRYLVLALAYGGQSMRVATVLGERSGGSKRTFTGASISVRGGYRLGKNFALELNGEVGQVGSSYTIGNAKGESSTKVIHWQLTPGLRFSTPGGIRFVGGIGLGLHGQVVDASIVITEGTSTVTHNVKGSGVSASWLGDIGVQVDIGPVFLEGLAFFDVHGVGTTRDDATNQRMFLSSPSSRAGIRLGLGIPF